MKKLVALALVGLASTAANAEIENPYVGVAGNFNFLMHDKDYGKDIFPKSRPYFNLNAGFEFIDGFGVELGYSDTSKHKDDVNVNSGQSPVVADSTLQGALKIKTEYKLSMPYLGLTKEINLKEFGMDKTNVKFMVGAAFARVKAKYYTIEDDGLDVDQATYTRTYSKTKVAPLVQVGVRQEVADNVSILGTVKYTHVGYKVKPDEATFAANEIKLSGVVGLGLGVQYTFA